jgi:Amidohydrolase family
MLKTDEAQGSPCDLVLTGARVIDPETGLDDVRNVGVTGTHIAVVSADPVPARRTVDVAGLVLAPGFIDLHSHAQTRTGLLLQALDGVTTALELEMGAASVSAALTAAEREGRPINYGYSASWLLSRMVLLDGAEVDEPFAMFVGNQARPNWQEPADLKDVGRVLDALEAEVAAGGIGIGVLIGYAPRTGRSEYFALAGLASRLGVPTFTHTRFISTVEPATSLEGALEVIAAAAGTGAHMHMCHLNSTSNRMIDDIADAVVRAQGQGLRVTTEAYPYGSGATVIGADFLAPEKLHRMGITPDSLCYLPTGEWVRDAHRLEEIRATDPGGPVIMRWADERDEADRAVLLRSLLLPDSVIASDAGPSTLPGGRLVDDEWPVPEAALNHPRSAGCYARTFGWLVRELGVLSLPEAVRRCTLLPAQFLEDAVPAMRAKGRIQAGADADIVVFDPQTFAERGDYEVVAPSVGVRHLLVGGNVVVDDGQLQIGSSAGRPVRSGN